MGANCSDQSSHNVQRDFQAMIEEISPQDRETSDNDGVSKEIMPTSPFLSIFRIGVSFVEGKIDF